MKPIFTYKIFAIFIAIVFFVCSTYSAERREILADIEYREHASTQTAIRLASFERTLQSTIRRYISKVSFVTAGINRTPNITPARLKSLIENESFQYDAIRGGFISSKPIVSQYSSEGLLFSVEYYEADVQYYIFQSKLNDGRFFILRLNPQAFIHETDFSPYKDGVRTAFLDMLSGDTIAGSKEIFNNPMTLMSIVYFNGGRFEIAALPHMKQDERMQMLATAFMWLFILVGTVATYIAVRFVQKLYLRKNAYGKLFYSSFAGMFNINPITGAIKSINDQAAITLGYASAKAVANRAISFYSHINNNETREKIADELSTSGNIRNINVKLTKRDGQTLWVQLSMKIVSEKICTCLIIDTDEDTRLHEEINRELEQVNFVIDNIPAALLLLNKDGNAVYSNIFAQIMLGKTSNNILGKNSSELFPADIAEEMYREDMEILSTANAPQSQEIVFGATGQAKKRYLLHKILRYSSAHQVQGLLYFIVDISVRRLVEESLKHKSEELADMEANFKTLVVAESEKLLAAEQFAFYKAKLSGISDTFEVMQHLDSQRALAMLQPTIESVRFDVYAMLKEIHALLSQHFKAKGIELRIAPLSQEFIGRVSFKGFMNELRLVFIEIMLGMRDNILQKIDSDSDGYCININVAILSFNIVVTIEDNSGTEYEDTSLEPLANILDNLNLYSAKLLIEHEMHGRLRNEYTVNGVKCVITFPNTLT